MNLKINITLISKIEEVFKIFKKEIFEWKNR